MVLSQDIFLDSEAFLNASGELNALIMQTQELREKMKQMYYNLTTALDTPAGKAIEFTAERVLLQPIDNLLLVFQHVSQTLSALIGEESEVVLGTGPEADAVQIMAEAMQNAFGQKYYKDVFEKYNELNESIQFK